MKISDLLSPELVKLHLASEAKEELFEEMVQVMASAGRIHDCKTAVEVLKRREEQMTTGVGNGIGIPHGKLDEAPHSLMALGISDGGIDYESLDGKPVYIVTAIFANPDNPGQHIEILAEVSRLFAIPGFSDKIRHAKSAEEVVELIRAEE